tara:strand:- start:101 stop:202 length:102 start_codon:yes stop_codon:yes gene_type:complete
MKTLTKIAVEIASAAVWAALLLFVFAAFFEVWA